MAYSSVPGPPLSGGLNLRDTPDQLEPSQAYDLLNVRFNERGGVQSRPGYQALTGSTTLTAATTVSAATITVASTASFDTTGSLTIAAGTAALPAMTVTYTGKTSTTFTGCSGVTAVAAIGTAVTLPATDSMGSFYTGSAWQIVSGLGNKLEVRGTTGALAASGTVATTANPHYFTTFGGPAAPLLWAANGTDQLRKWSGTAWTTPTWTITNSSPNPTGKFVAVTPWDNRLANARYSSTAGGQNKSSVRFSLPYLPESWDGFNWVDLTPGDGESIMGMASYDNYLIVFKETKFFTFYGTGTAASGVAEFQYRAVDNGIGLAAPGLLCVGRDGVYFVSKKGVFRTDGGVPQLISDIVNPLFTGTTGVLYGGNPINFASLSKATIFEHNQQIYLSCATGTSSYNDTTFVYDMDYRWWSRWDTKIAKAVVVDISGTNAGSSIVFALSRITAPATSPTDQSLAYINESLATDNDAGIQSRIKFGFSNLGTDSVKTIRESQVWGTGTVRYALAKDFAGSANAATLSLGVVTDAWAGGDVPTDLWADGTTSDLWGGGQNAGVATARNSVRGLILGPELYSSSATVPPSWAVNKIIYRIREQRVPSVQKTDR